jgi:hypothetical protein
METAKPKTPAPAPAKAAPVEQLGTDLAKQRDMLAEIEQRDKEIESLRQQLAEWKGAKGELARDELGSQVEVVNIAGLVMEKTVYPDGDSDVQVLSEPLIDAELILATKAHQRAQGF